MLQSLSYPEWICRNSLRYNYNISPSSLLLLSSHRESHLFPQYSVRCQPHFRWKNVHTMQRSFWTRRLKSYHRSYVEDRRRKSHGPSWPIECGSYVHRTVQQRRTGEADKREPASYQNLKNKLFNMVDQIIQVAFKRKTWYHTGKL